VHWESGFDWTSLRTYVNGTQAIIFVWNIDVYVAVIIGNYQKTIQVNNLFYILGFWP